MDEPYRPGFVRRVLNVMVRIGVWTGGVPRRFFLLTVRGRRSGRSYSTPVIVLTRGGNRWLVAPYGERAWARMRGPRGR
jgi:hypothetical protein